MKDLYTIAIYGHDEKYYRKIFDRGWVEKLDKVKDPPFEPDIQKYLRSFFPEKALEIVSFNVDSGQHKYTGKGWKVKKKIHIMIDNRNVFINTYPDLGIQVIAEEGRNLEILLPQTWEVSLYLTVLMILSGGDFESIVDLVRKEG